MNIPIVCNCFKKINALYIMLSIVLSNLYALTRWMLLCQAIKMPGILLLFFLHTPFVCAKKAGTNLHKQLTLLCALHITLFNSSSSL